jgi:hypothetical protein
MPWPDRQSAVLQTYDSWFPIGCGRTPTALAQAAFPLKPAAFPITLQAISKSCERIQRKGSLYMRIAVGWTQS